MSLLCLFRISEWQSWGMKVSHYWLSNRPVRRPDRQRLFLAVGKCAVRTAICRGASAPGSEEEVGDETVIGLLPVMLKNTAVVAEEAEDNPVKPAAPGATTVSLPGK